MSGNIIHRPVKSIGEKFDFINQVFSNPRHRTKQKASPLTPIRAAVTCKVAQYFNLDRGYSFVSERRIAEEIGCSQPSVNNALKWLESEGHIKRVDDCKANSVGRYVILIRADNSHENYQHDKSHENNLTDNFHESDQTEKSHKNNPKRNNGTKVKLNENGPSRCGSRRKAATPSRGPVDVNKAMNYLTRS